MLFKIQKMISSINEVISNYEEDKNKSNRKKSDLSGIEEDDLSVDSMQMSLQDANSLRFLDAPKEFPVRSSFGKKTLEVKAQSSIQSKHLE